MRIRIGTRSSPLALSQVKIISDTIKLSWPDAEIIPVPIRTSGDKDMTSFSTNTQGIKGMFTYEIEEALKEGDIDIAVHSLKDLPVNMNPELPILAYARRGNPLDALLSNTAENAINVIGTSSMRRRLQVEKIYPSARVIPLRGNVGTRLRKLDSGELGENSGIVLAVSGLERLGMSHRIVRIFSPEEVMPSPGQGILACQGRAGERYEYLSCVDDEISRYCGTAERSFSENLGAGCNIPAGAYAEIYGNILTLKGLYIDDDGEIHRGIISGKCKDAKIIGMKLAEVILG